MFTIQMANKNNGLPRVSHFSEIGWYVSSLDTLVRLSLPIAAWRQAEDADSSSEIKPVGQSGQLRRHKLDAGPIKIKEILFCMLRLV